jgi:hypothetical protein
MKEITGRGEVLANSIEHLKRAENKLFDPDIAERISELERISRDM